MKIISLEAENLKRLKAVRIEPNGNMVEITGKNGQGKTSVLDAIWWAMGGIANVQTTPIRKGEQRAVIRLDMGELKVTRTFTAKEGGEYTTALKVENGEGARYQSPQTMLDKLLGELTFDPLRFKSMKAADQVLALRSLVKDYDFAAAAEAHKQDYADRTDSNRRHKEAAAAAEAAGRDLPDKIPEEQSASDIIAKIEAAQKANERVDRWDAAKAKFDADCEAYKKKIERLRAELEEEERLRDENYMKEDDLGERPERLDIAPIRAKLETIEADNAIARRAAAHEKELDRAKAFKEEADALTDAIDARKKAAQEAIAKADLPVSGLDILDGLVLLDGLPFDQASDAQQLQASIGIAMALNPSLKVVRVRDGSLLDEDAMKMLAEMADANDYQIWIERVDSSGEVGFVLEDGHIKGQVYEPTPEQEKAAKGASDKPAPDGPKEGSAAARVAARKAGPSLFDQKEE